MTGRDAEPQPGVVYMPTTAADEALRTDVRAMLRDVIRLQRAWVAIDARHIMPPALSAAVAIELAEARWKMERTINQRRLQTDGPIMPESPL